MKNSPYFTIIIPLYNKEKYIKNTINSVLNQKFDNFELVIIDDGSKDKSCEIIQNINDNRIRLILQKNGGPSKARNRGIEEASGQFIAFLDADDEWLPNYLIEHYLLFSNNSTLKWSCTGYDVIGGKRKETIIYPKNGIQKSTIDAIMQGMSITSSSIVIKRDIFNNKSLLFNELYKRSEDREVWYKIACLYPEIAYIRKSLVNIYANTEGSLNATGLEDMDFSFLSLEERIINQLETLEETERNKFINYLNNLILRRMLTIWGWTYSFNKVSINFQPFFTKNTIRLLKNLNFLPLLMKKIFVKVYLKYGKEKG